MGVVHLILAFALAGLGITAWIVARAQGGDWQAIGVLIGMSSLAAAGFFAVTGFALVASGKKVRADSRAARGIALAVALLAGVAPMFLTAWLAAGNSPGIDAIVLMFSSLAAWAVPHGVLAYLLANAR